MNQAKSVVWTISGPCHNTCSAVEWLHKYHRGLNGLYFCISNIQAVKAPEARTLRSLQQCADCTQAGCYSHLQQEPASTQPLMKVCKPSLCKESNLSWHIPPKHTARVHLPKFTNCTQSHMESLAVIYLWYQNDLKNFDGKCQALPGPLMWELSSQLEEPYHKKHCVLCSSEGQHNAEGRKSEAAHKNLEWEEGHQ